jgi:DNA polymerase sigma
VRYASRCRLVKLWASAHDLNDASRSTFNSTSLLYLTIFYLQLQQLVPPLHELVDPLQLNDQTCRLLHPANKYVGG